MYIGRAVRAGRWNEKKRTGQEKVTKGLHFTYLGRRPIEAIPMKNCVVGDVLDVITCVKFQNETGKSYDFTGVEFSIFLLISEWAYWHIHIHITGSATALPVIWI